MPAGGAVLAPSVASALISRPAAQEPSPRELEVLRLVARGAANKEIARALLISETTVKTHLKHVFAKLGVETRAAAVVVAMERGLL
ncbi:response regulator transcription factor [Nonomuraea wenchangensis]|uniref:response regulator transcription factor n=1 Tax=Nonomuraea wenchangensis TaxID=568860 RepID=UPI0033268863